MKLFFDETLSISCNAFAHSSIFKLWTVFIDITRLNSSFLKGSDKALPSHRKGLTLEI